MKLLPDDQVWCPVDHPEYLCLLRPSQKPPVKLDDFLLRQVDLLERLLADASEGEKKAANVRWTTTWLGKH